MTQINSADVVIVGTGVVGCSIAEQALDAGLSVLMLEAGPRVERWQIVENFRNLPPSLRNKWDAPFPAPPWAPVTEAYTLGTPDQYLQLEGPDAEAYQQGYVRYAGGATWHWAGICWRLTPDDMRLKSLYNVGRDWPFDYHALEPYYTRAEYLLGVAGPSDPQLQWPALRSKPYPMERLPFGPGEQRFTDAAAAIGVRNLPAAQARVSGTTWQGRPACCGNNNCFPVCPIGAKYDAATTLPRIESKGGRILENAVVYKVETSANNKSVQAVHYFDPHKQSHRVTGKVFVIACNGIETPKLLLLSKDEKNPRGVANSSDQVGRNMMDQPKISAKVVFSEPLWTGVGPVQASSIMDTSQGDFRGQYAGALIRMENLAHSLPGSIAALQKGLVGKALDREIRRLSACMGDLTIEHEPLPWSFNRLTLSDKKDWLGINKPNIYYDVSDYVRRSAKEYSVPILKQLMDKLGVVESQISTKFGHSDHIMGGCIMGTDATRSVVDADCRTHDHENLFLPGGGAMPSGGSGNSTLTMTALAIKSGDAIINQLRGA